MSVVESLEDKPKTYKVTFLRGRREGAHIEISEIIETEDAEEALDIAFKIAEKAKWHIEKMERIS